MGTLYYYHYLLFVIITIIIFQSSLICMIDGWYNSNKNLYRIEIVNKLTLHNY